MDNNLIMSLPLEITNLYSLQYLYIANNDIEELPINIGLLSNLQILSLYSNHLLEIPESIGSLNSLFHLDLTNNGLIMLPNSICNIYDNLSVLDISLNNICPPPGMPWAIERAEVPKGSGRMVCREPMEER